MIGCAKGCLEKQENCKEEKCRMWIDYGEDLNCTVISVKNNPEMTLSEVSKRLDISLVRVKQIQDKALQKLKKIYYY